MAEEIKITNQQLESLFKAMKDSLTQEQREGLGPIVIELETLKRIKETTASKSDIQAVETKINGLLEEHSKHVTQLLDIANKNQPIIDNMIAIQERQLNNQTSEKKDWNMGWKDVVEGMKTKGIKENDNFGRDSKLEFNLKTTMTQATTISGGGVNTYNSRQGLLPTQKRNFRDLITTTQSKTGLFVTYRETSSAQSAGVQTEGSDKANFVYTFTAGTSTLKYIAGYVTFTKQLMFNLDFFESTLPRMLQRDFFRKENDYLYTTIAGNATGSNAAANPTPTVDIEEIIRMIGNQRNAEFDASIGIIDWNEWARLAVTKPNDYSMPLVVTSPNNDALFVAGMPLVGASYAQTDHLLLFDTDYVERVEGESLRVEFSYENNDNFQKNLISARVECFEEVNLLRTDAIIYRDFGNS